MPQAQAERARNEAGGNRLPVGSGIASGIVAPASASRIARVEAIEAIAGTRVAETVFLLDRRLGAPLRAVTHLLTVRTLDLGPICVH